MQVGKERKEKRIGDGLWVGVQGAPGSGRGGEIHSFPSVVPCGLVDAQLSHKMMTVPCDGLSFQNVSLIRWQANTLVRLQFEIRVIRLLITKQSSASTSHPSSPNSMTASDSHHHLVRRVLRPRPKGIAISHQDDWDRTIQEDQYQPCIPHERNGYRDRSSTHAMSKARNPSRDEAQCTPSLAYI